MKIRTVNADGSTSDQQEFDLPIVDAQGAPYDPPVVIRCQMIQAAQRKAFERQATEHVKNPVTRGMVKEVNYDTVADLMMVAGVVSWTNIDGADGQPLVCTPETRPHLPSHVKVQVLEAVSTTEAADQAESFREPADVVRMVGGRGAQ